MLGSPVTFTPHEFRRLFSTEHALTVNSARRRPKNGEKHFLLRGIALGTCHGPFRHPASTGRVTGTVRVMNGPEDFDSFLEGEILVAKGNSAGLDTSFRPRGGRRHRRRNLGRPCVSGGPRIRDPRRRRNGRRNPPTPHRTTRHRGRRCRHSPASPDSSVKTAGSLINRIKICSFL